MGLQARQELDDVLGQARMVPPQKKLQRHLLQLSPGRRVAQNKRQLVFKLRGVDLQRGDHPQGVDPLGRRKILIQRTLQVVVEDCPRRKSFAIGPSHPIVFNLAGRHLRLLDYAPGENAHRHQTTQ